MLLEEIRIQPYVHIFSFDDEAYAALRAFEDEITRRVRDPKKEERAELPGMADTQYHSRYLENITRLAVTLHVLYAAMQADVENRRQLRVNLTIPLSTLLKAKSFADHCTLQKAYMIQVGISVGWV